jgi:tetratricopeptide (TPR) repeat protein
VRNLLGRPLIGISVEVRNIQTHSTITRAISGSNGAAVFQGLLPGRYEITVAGGLLPPRQEMQVDGADSRTVLELPISQLKAGETVSVQQLTVPRKAQEALEAASEALQKRDWKKARAQATRALTLRPDYAAALSLLGYLDLQDGNPEMASDDVKRAIESDPNSALAYLTLGSAYNSLKRYEAALEALSVFLSVSADAWQLHYEVARSYMGLHKFELGLIEINLAQKLAPQDPAVLVLGKAHALAGLHRNSEAIAELEMLLRKQPKGPFAPDAQSFLALLRSQKQH